MERLAQRQLILRLTLLALCLNQHCYVGTLNFEYLLQTKKWPLLRPFFLPDYFFKQDVVKSLKFIHPTFCINPDIKGTFSVGISVIITVTT